MYDVTRSGSARAAGEPGPLPSSSEDEAGEPGKGGAASRKRPAPGSRGKEESETEFVDFEDEEEEVRAGGLPGRVVCCIVKSRRGRARGLIWKRER